MSDTPPASWQPPSHWNHPASEWPWPEWERTCPGCGRYHRWFYIESDSFRCVVCEWSGQFPSAADTDKEKQA